MTEAPSVSAETELKGLRLPARTDDEFTAVHTGEANTPHLPSSMSTQPLQPEVHARAPFAVGRGRFPALRCRPVVGRFLPGGCFRHQLLLPSHYLVLTKPLSAAGSRPFDVGPWSAGSFPEGASAADQLLLPSHYLVLTKPLRLDIQCQRAWSSGIGVGAAGGPGGSQSMHVCQHQPTLVWPSPSVADLDN